MKKKKLMLTVCLIILIIFSTGCSSTSEDEMLELIISMSPSKITLYDLSRGALGGFVDSIKSIFGEIVVILS